MSEETAPTPAPDEPPKKKRRPSWHPATIAGALDPGKRPGDPEIRWKVATAKAGAKLTALGLVGWALMSAMTMVGDTLKAHRTALEAMPAAMAAAVRAEGEANRRAMEGVADRLESLTGRADQLQAEASTVRGMVLGRLRCPACPSCPTCPPCPPASQGVPRQPDPAWHPRER